jgi:hypothetical protein
MEELPMKMTWAPPTGSTVDWKAHHAELEKFFGASGFSGDIAHNLANATKLDMDEKPFSVWSRACTDWWRATYAKRNAGYRDVAYAGVVRELASKSLLPKYEEHETKWLAYYVFYAKLYTGIYHHLLELEGETSVCSEGSSWWKAAWQERCEFERFCNRPQDSDKGGKPLHGEFAAAMTIAVAKFVEFACTFSWVGLPSYEADRTKNKRTETADTIPLKILACAYVSRAHVDRWVADARTNSVEGGLSKQAQRFLVGILCNEYNSKPNRNVSLYVSGLPYDAPKVHWASVKPNAPGKKRMTMDDVAKLVHWCAEEMVAYGVCRNRDPTRTAGLCDGRVMVGIYVGDALLLSATRGRERVVLARTKYKVGNRNEMCVVHVHGPAPVTAVGTSPIHVDMKTRRLIDEALERGRLGLVFTLHEEGRSRTGLDAFRLGEKETPSIPLLTLYRSDVQIKSAEDILVSSGCCAAA